MTQVPAPEHKSVTIADQLINGTLAEVVTNATVAAIKVRLPWMPNWILNLVVGKILAVAFAEAAKFVAVSIIAADNAADRARYDEAAEKLKETISIPAEHFGSEEQKNAEIEKARQEFKNRLRDLIRFGK